MKSAKKANQSLNKSVKKVALKGSRVVARKTYGAKADDNSNTNSSRKIDSFHLDQKLLEFKPYGLAMGPLETRPVFLLKSLEDDLILPIWLNQKEAVDSLGGAQGTLQSPHIVTEHVLQALNCEILRAEFIELEGAHQWVQIFCSSEKRAFKIKEKATSALALCLHFKVPFYATAEFVQSCRNIEASLFQEYAQIDSQKMDRKRSQGYLM